MKLATQPSASVSVTVESDDTTSVTVPSSTFTFTASTWNTAQSVTVTGVQDNDAVNETPTVTATASSSDADYSGKTAHVIVNVTDDEAAGLVVNPTILPVTEGATTIFFVKLATQPSAGVTVAVASDDTSSVTAAPPPLTFPTSNWNAGQTVTVTCVEDSDSTSETPTVTATASSSDSHYDGETAQVTVNVTDNDTAGILADPSILLMTEGDTTTFQVKLATQPSAGVTVAVASDDTGAVTAAPTPLTFTTSNWNVDQTVTVTGVEDNDARLESPTITLTAVSGDPDYEGRTAQVFVTVADNDLPALVMDPSSLPVTEGGTNTFTVKLATQPSAGVTVVVASDDTSSVTVPSSALSFTTSNWNTAQTVTVTGVEDSDSTSETPTVTATASSSDVHYDGETAQVTVTVTDNDTAGLIVDPLSLPVTEGSTNTFTENETGNPALCRRHRSGGLR